jgi:CTP:molybdopterin cytidylyltransferase MocA
MLAHIVLIITSHLSGKFAPDALDRAIKQLLWMKKTIILVLGPDGDEVMRTCSQMDACEILFDPNDAGPFSPIKAGLHATDAAAYVWFADQKFPTNDDFRRLDTALRTLDDSSIECLQIPGVPLTLLTPTGVRNLKEKPSDSAWPLASLKTLDA